jgi:hypothetical protein
MKNFIKLTIFTDLWFLPARMLRIDEKFKCLLWKFKLLFLSCQYYLVQKFFNVQSSCETWKIFQIFPKQFCQNSRNHSRTKFWGYTIQQSLRNRLGETALQSLFFHKGCMQPSRVVRLSCSTVPLPGAHDALLHRASGIGAYSASAASCRTGVIQYVVPHFPPCPRSFPILIVKHHEQQDVEVQNSKWNSWFACS